MKGKVDRVVFRLCVLLSALLIEFKVRSEQTSAFMMWVEVAARETAYPTSPKARAEYGDLFS